MASSKITELDENNICKLCENALGRYVCPKCDVLYCSLQCYQSDQHRNCSEQFYKNNVFEELKLNENDPAEKSRMLEILTEVHEKNLLVDNTLVDNDSGDSDALDSDDNQELEDIAQRLANVDLDNAEKVWEKLTEDERKEFAAFLQSEDVTKLIPTWNPWWLYYNETKVHEVNNKVDDYKSSCPCIGDIEKFSSICKKQPTESVKYNLINILAGYAFTTRYFNGECTDFSQEAISCLGSVALSLRCHQDFNDFEIAVKSVEQECVNTDWIMTDAENISSMRDDLEKILRGPTKIEPKYYVLSALADLHNLLKMALQKKDNKSEGSFAKHFPNAHFPEVKLHTAGTVKVYTKRIEYFLSYVQNFFIVE